MNTNTAINKDIIRIMKEINLTTEDKKIPFCPLKVECDTISPAGSGKFPCKNCSGIVKMANEIYASRQEIAQQAEQADKPATQALLSDIF